MAMRHVRFLLIALLSCIAVLASAQQPDLSAEKAKLAKLDSAYTLAKKQYTAKKSVAKLRASYLTATLSYANGVMYSPALSSKDKYPRALRLYREVLVLDPKHKEAKESKETIEAIYKSMNRPIPK